MGFNEDDLDLTEEEIEREQAERLYRKQQAKLGREIPEEKSERPPYGMLVGVPYPPLPPSVVPDSILADTPPNCSQCGKPTTTDAPNGLCCKCLALSVGWTPKSKINITKSVYIKRQWSTKPENDEQGRLF